MTKQAFFFQVSVYYDSHFTGNSSCVRVVSSYRSGMGKSLYVRRMAEQLELLQMEQSGADPLVSIPIHGPLVSADTVVEFLQEHFDAQQCSIFHFDIAPTVRDPPHTTCYICVL